MTWKVMYHTSDRQGPQQITVKATNHKTAYDRAYKKLKEDSKEDWTFHILSTEKA